MINARIVRVVVVSMIGVYSTAVIAMDNKKNIDIRKFGLEFPHNKQDERKNTFWHKLAVECEQCEDWSEVETKKELFKQNNNNWLPNPLIENESGNTAKKEAKARYNRSGNPVCGLLVYHFQAVESEYLNKLAVKENQGLMLLVQHGRHPGK
jgi:hypothetical protein